MMQHLLLIFISFSLKTRGIVALPHMSFRSTPSCIWGSKYEKNRHKAAFSWHLQGASELHNFGDSLSFPYIKCYQRRRIFPVGHLLRIFWANITFSWWLVPWLVNWPGQLSNRPRFLVACNIYQMDFVRTAKMSSLRHSSFVPLFRFSILNYAEQVHLFLVVRPVSPCQCDAFLTTVVLECRGGGMDWSGRWGRLRRSSERRNWHHKAKCSSTLSEETKENLGYITIQQKVKIIEQHSS